MAQTNNRQTRYERYPSGREIYGPYDPYDRDATRRYSQQRYDDSGLVNQTPSVANGQRSPLREHPRPERYSQRQIPDPRLQEAALRARENDGLARGLLLGVVLMSLIGLVAGVLFFLTEQNRQTVPIVPAPAGVEPEAPEIPTNTNTEIRERVIERTEIVPVPQQEQAPLDQPTVVESQPLPTQDEAIPAEQPELEGSQTENSELLEGNEAQVQ